MKVYNEQHAYNCGIDLQARTMHVCILDRLVLLLTSHRTKGGIPEKKQRLIQ